jgi:glutamine cyclotransferase
VIARIDPATGVVKGWVDFTGLLPAIDRSGKEDCFNGIAWDEGREMLYVTGKLWPKMYAVKLGAGAFAAPKKKKGKQ